MSRTFFSAAHGCDLFLFALSPDNDTYVDPNEIYLPLTLEQTAKKLTQAVNGSLILSSIYFLGQTVTEDYFCEDILMMSGDTERKSCIKLRYGCNGPNFDFYVLSADIFSQGVMFQTLQQINASAEFTKQVYAHFLTMTLFPNEFYIFLNWGDRKNQLEQSLLNSPEFIQFFRRCSFDALCELFDEATYRIFKHHESISVYYPAIFERYFLFLKQFLRMELTQISALLPAEALNEPAEITRLICVRKILRTELDYFIEEISSATFNENQLMRFSDIASATINLLVPVLNHDPMMQKLFIRFFELSAFLKNQVEFLKKYSLYVMIDADFQISPQEKNEIDFRFIVKTLRFWMTEWPLFQMPEDKKRTSERVTTFLCRSSDRYFQSRDSLEESILMGQYIESIKDNFIQNKNPNAVAILCLQLSSMNEESLNQIGSYFFKQLASYFVFEFISEMMTALLKSRKIDFVDRIKLLMLLIERDAFIAEVLAALIQLLAPLHAQARQATRVQKHPVESRASEIVSRSSTPAASSASSSENYFSFLYSSATIVNKFVLEPFLQRSQGLT